MQLFKKKIFGSGLTTLIISNEAKQKKGRFPSTLLGILGASLVGYPLTGKGVKRSKMPGRGVIRADEGTIRAGQDGAYVINLGEYKSIRSD